MSDNPSKLILGVALVVFVLGVCAVSNAGRLPNAIRKIVGLVFTLIGVAIFIIITTGIVNGLKTANPTDNVAQGVIAAAVFFGIPILLSLGIGLRLIFYKK
jgi:hypothetical protein